MSIVAVSQRVDLLPSREERRDALDQRLGNWLAQSGYVPVGVPNGLPDAHQHGAIALANWLAAIRPAAIVLSGGNDIGAAPERDRCELGLIDYAREHGLPLLGICRGMQMMGVAAGATLTRVDGHVARRHMLSGVISGEVNSFHQYALMECPAHYDVLARSTDGHLEAMRHRQLAWEGWMWHPEREAEFSTQDRQRLQALFGTLSPH